MSENGFPEKDLSRMLLRIRFFLICIVDLFIILVFAGHADIASRAGRDDVWTGVETDGQTPCIASCRLFNLTSLMLSIVVVDVGSYWFRLLMMAIIMFE